MNQPTIEPTVRNPQLVAGELNEILREIAESYPGQVATLVAQCIAARLDSIAEETLLDMAEWLEARAARGTENTKEERWRNPQAV